MGSGVAFTAGADFGRPHEESVVTSALEVPHTLDFAIMPSTRTIKLDTDPKSGRLEACLATEADPPLIQRAGASLHLDLVIDHREAVFSSQVAVQGFIAAIIR